MEKLKVPTSDDVAVRSRVTVLYENGVYRLVASESIATGEVVFRTEGDEIDRPSRFSVQIDDHLHIDLPPGTDLNEAADRFPWRFLNHSCAPNVRLCGRDWIALRPIAAGEEVAFDYATTEYRMATPFPCRCGSPGCRGQITGFVDLSRADQVRLLPLLAPHLRRLVEGSDGPGR